MNMNTMNTTTPPPTPETDAIILARNGFGLTQYEWREHGRRLERERDEARDQLKAMERAGAEQARRADENREWALRAERERNEAREQIASCAINTNVRFFDLVRHMRAPLHKDGLITDEEYFWLCGGCDMANSPEGGSPSPRRLEDYDVLNEKLQAMREAIKEARIEINYALRISRLALRVCPYESGVDLVLSRIKAALAKLQPFIAP